MRLSGRRSNPQPSGGIPVVFYPFLDGPEAAASGKKSSVEEKRGGEMLNTCVKFGLSQKREKGVCVCVCVCVCLQQMPGKARQLSF